MLLKSSISNISIYSDEWFVNRLAKFTSSEFYLLMGEKGIGDTGRNYIYRKLGEELTGIATKKEVSTEATEHGNMYEMENLQEFGKAMKIDFLVTQKLISPIDSRYSSTPDALIVDSETPDKVGYNVYTVEAKCPLSYDGYIKLWKCKTPQQLKQESKQYYYQVLHQMYVCDSLRGYLSVYHPNFKVGKLNIIEFKRTELTNEFKLIKERTEQAIRIFEETRNEMIGI